MIHSFLLIGQSNAAGRGFLNEAEPLDNRAGRLKVLRNGLWVKMFRPVNPDRVTSGVCFAEAFAKAYADIHPNVEVGIIPCADGGTTISQWQPGQNLFENAVHCARMAMRTSSLKGILWHQGEGDCTESLAPLYTERFFGMADALRKDLDRPDLPILVGGLGDFLSDHESESLRKYYPAINESLQAIGKEYPRCAFVSAEGLSGNPDNLHFSAKAQAELGLRYFDAWRPFDQRDDEDVTAYVTTDRSAMEQL